MTDFKAPQPAPEYGYSFCEERYSGPFATLDEALAEARSDRPEATHTWIGEVRYPAEMISAESLGRAIEEHIGDVLGDEVGDAAENFVLDAELRKCVGTLVLDWIKAGPGFHCWGVKNVREVELNPEPTDTATVDMFNAPEGQTP
jgi:hypothetical protein